MFFTHALRNGYKRGLRNLGPFSVSLTCICYNQSVKSVITRNAFKKSVTSRSSCDHQAIREMTEYHDQTLQRMTKVIHVLLLTLVYRPLVSNVDKITF